MQRGRREKRADLAYAVRRSFGPNNGSNFRQLRTSDPDKHDGCGRTVLGKRGKACRHWSRCQMGGAYCLRAEVTTKDSISLQGQRPSDVRKRYAYLVSPVVKRSISRSEGQRERAGRCRGYSCVETRREYVKMMISSFLCTTGTSLG